nr:hypothetical protein [Cerasicoccus frondis]
MSQPLGDALLGHHGSEGVAQRVEVDFTPQRINTLNAGFITVAGQAFTGRNRGRKYASSAIGFDG